MRRLDDERHARPTSPVSEGGAEEVTAAHVSLALEASGVGTWEVELASNTVVWSPVMERMHGVAEGSFDRTLESHESFIHPEDLPGVRSAALEALKDDIRFHVRYRIRRNDGATRWIESRGAVLRDVDGQPIRTVGVSSDVTSLVRRTQADKLLAETAQVLGSSSEFEENLRTLARLVVPAIADACAVDVLDRAGLAERLAWSEAASEEGVLESFRGHELATLGIGAVLRTGHAELVDTVDDVVLSGLAKGEQIRDRLRRSGLRSYACVPLRAGGEMVGVLSLLSAGSGAQYDDSDLEVARRMAHQISSAYERTREHRRAEQAVRVRDEVLAVVSHDLRNPLNTIRLASTVLRGEAGDDEVVVGRLDAVERAVSRANALIDDLLEVANIEGGSLAVRLEPCNASKVLAELETMHGPQARARGQTLERVDAPQPCRIFADRGRVVQAIGNLLSNAIRHAPREGKIRFGVDQGPEFAEFFVEDDGPGVESDQLEHLFEPFWQARRVRKKGGAGLGLAIARGIAAAHGGRIWVDEARTRGARFVLTVPMAKGRPVAEESTVSIMES